MSLHIESKYDAEVEALMKEFADWPRGGTLPWKLIEAVMGRNREEVGGWTIIRRFRKRLLKQCKIVTLPLDTVGLRFLTHEETLVEIPRLRLKKAYRQMSRGVREMDTVPPESLTDFKRLMLVRRKEHMRKHRLQLGRSKREIEKLMCYKSPTHPIRAQRRESEAVAV